MFLYHNENPRGWKRGSDCVVRAISFASGESWDETFSGLCELGLKYKRMPNVPRVYEKYLADKGFKKMKQPRHSDNSLVKVRELAKMIPSGTVVVTMRNHMSVIKEGVIHDTWDCGGMNVGNFWEYYPE